MRYETYITLKNGTLRSKSIRWYKKKHIVITGTIIHDGIAWIRVQQFLIPKELQKEEKTIILQHLNELQEGGWYEYTKKP